MVIICNYMYLAARIVMEVITMDPLVNYHHCNPYDAVIEKNVIILNEGFPIFLDVATLHDDFETKPKKTTKTLIISI